MLGVIRAASGRVVMIPGSRVGRVMIPEAVVQGRRAGGVRGRGCARGWGRGERWIWKDYYTSAQRTQRPARRSTIIRQNDESPGRSDGRALVTASRTLYPRNMAGLTGARRAIEGTSD